MISFVSQQATGQISKLENCYNPGTYTAGKTVSYSNLLFIILSSATPLPYSCILFHLKPPLFTIFQFLAVSKWHLRGYVTAFVWKVSLYHINNKKVLCILYLFQCKSVFPQHELSLVLCSPA